MVQALEFFFDDTADRAVRALWDRLDRAGVPSMGGRSHGGHRPHVSFASAASIPPATRNALRTDLRRLSIPRLWLSTLGVFATTENVLVLSAVVDTELLAVHSAVHDVLAGRVRHPSAYYLPGSWVPHCTLAQGIDDDQVVAGIAALHPVESIRASIAGVAVVDVHTGEADPLL